jgi:hypothetical protein
MRRPDERHPDGKGRQGSFHAGLDG